MANNHFSSYPREQGLEKCHDHHVQEVRQQPTLYNGANNEGIAIRSQDSGETNESISFPRVPYYAFSPPWYHDRGGIIGSHPLSRESVPYYAASPLHQHSPPATHRVNMSQHGMLSYVYDRRQMVPTIQVMPNYGWQQPPPGNGHVAPSLYNSSISTQPLVMMTEQPYPATTNPPVGHAYRHKSPDPEFESNQSTRDEKIREDNASLGSYSPISLPVLHRRASATIRECVPEGNFDSGDSAFRQDAARAQQRETDMANGLPEPSKTVSPEQQAKWEEMFQRLVKFKEAYGHTRVPETYEDKKLVHWVGNQRKAMSKLDRGCSSGHMDKRRITMLNSIKFEWARARATKPGMYERCTWEEMLENLCKFKKVHGHTRVSPDRDQRLSNWVRNQRTAMSRRKRGLPYRCLTEKRIKVLESIGFEWIVSKESGNGSVTYAGECLNDSQNTSVDA